MRGSGSGRARRGAVGCARASSMRCGESESIAHATRRTIRPGAGRATSTGADGHGCAVTRGGGGWSSICGCPTAQRRQTSARLTETPTAARMRRYSSSREYTVNCRTTCNAQRTAPLLTVATLRRKTYDGVLCDAVPADPQGIWVTPSTRSRQFWRVLKHLGGTLLPRPPAVYVPCTAANSHR